MHTKGQAGTPGSSSLAGRGALRSAKVPLTPWDSHLPPGTVFSLFFLELKFSARQLAIPSPPGRTWSYGGEEGVPPAPRHQAQVLPQSDFNLANSNSLDANQCTVRQPL